MAEGKPKSPLDHYSRAQELLEEIDAQQSRTSHNRAWFDVRTQLAHLHLRAAEVGAALPRKRRPTVADSISAASLSQPMTALGHAVGGMTPGQVSEIVQETIEAEKRRGNLR